MKPKVSASTSTVHSPTFEAAIVKVINREAGCLTASERKAIKRFKVLAAPPVVGSKRKQRGGEGDESKNEEEDFASAVLRSRRLSAAEQKSSLYCELLKNLPPTSNRCERLFSQAKQVLTPQRASLLPMNFEMLVFLRANRTYWDVTTVQEVYQQI
ncbi:unnamed protein product [Phytophthora fragariaefolia]|uniref:Unnamed protein product n=1 Tax=Phytophthora fragariaefolia TaxID=1490495 RepID=A0A9W6YN15_9STRA|nr:unnamed protein product [Phytophthora fragariaefolia]